MSDERDERDNADAAGDSTEDAGGGQPAGVARPSRPSGKRSRSRGGSTALAEPEETESTAVELGVSDEDEPDKKAKKEKKVKESKDSKDSKDKAKKGSKKGTETSRNPFIYIWTYLTQVVGELRKVIWPNRKQMVTYTSVVLLFLAFMVAVIGGIDLGLAKLVLLIFG